VGAVIEGDQTKEDIKAGTGKGVPKGWFEFKGESYRRLDLTADPLFENIKIETMVLRDRMLAKATAEAESEAPAS
jgi:hypothetical protein